MYVHMAVLCCRVHSAKRLFAVRRLSHKHSRLPPAVPCCVPRMRMLPMASHVKDMTYGHLQGHTHTHHFVPPNNIAVRFLDAHNNARQPAAGNPTQRSCARCCASYDMPPIGRTHEWYFVKGSFNEITRHLPLWAPRQMVSLLSIKSCLPFTAQSKLSFLCSPKRKCIMRYLFREDRNIVNKLYKSYKVLYSGTSFESILSG